MPIGRVLNFPEVMYKMVPGGDLQHALIMTPTNEELPPNPAHPISHPHQSPPHISPLHQQHLLASIPQSQQARTHPHQIILNSPTRVVYSPQGTYQLDGEFLDVHQIPLSGIENNPTLYSPSYDKNVLYQSGYSINSSRIERDRRSTNYDRDVLHSFNTPSFSDGVSSNAYLSDTLSDHSDISSAASSVRQKNLQRRYRKNEKPTLHNIYNAQKPVRSEDGRKSSRSNPVYSDNSLKRNSSLKRNVYVRNDDSGVSSVCFSESPSADTDIDVRDLKKIAPLLAKQKESQV